MMKQFFRFSLITGIVVGMMLLTSVHYAQAKDTLIIGVPESCPGVDTDIHINQETWRLVEQLYARPLEHDFKTITCRSGEELRVPEATTIIPGLIESWELSNNGKTLTCHLRKGVKSAYGNDLTTKDVAWSYERNFALKAVGAWWCGQQGIPDMDHIKFIDDYTFSFNSPYATRQLYDMLTSIYFCWWDSTEVKKHTTAEDPWALEWCARNGSGFGPYTVQEWIAGDRIVLKSNPNFYLGEPPIKTLIWKAIAEAANRVAMIQDGTIDVAHDLEPNLVKSLEGKTGVKVIQHSGNMEIWGILNNTMPPTDKKEIRQAMNYALPRVEICETAYLGYARPKKAPIPNGFNSALPEEMWPYKLDLVKAKELLKQGGYPNGFKIDLVYRSGSNVLESAATLIKSSMAKIGINVSLRKLPVGSYMKMWSDKKMHFGLWEDMPMYDDPWYVLRLQYWSESISNAMQYKNPEVDKMINEGREIQDFNEKLKYYTPAQQMIVDDGAMVFMWEPDYTVALRDNVMGWNWNTIQETRYDWVHFSK